MAEFLEVLYFSCPLHATSISHGTVTGRIYIHTVAMTPLTLNPLLCFSFTLFLSIVVSVYAFINMSLCCSSCAWSRAVEQCSEVVVG